MAKNNRLKTPIFAAAQMCSSNDIDDNLKIVKRLIHEAAMNNANIIVLPEMFAIMGVSDKDKVLKKEKPGNGLIQQFLSDQAKANNIWIVGGTIPIECNDPEKVRAASYVFNDQGDCVARYDKIHLFDVVLSENETYRESNTTEAGDDAIVVNTPFGNLGLAVCYDVRFPELFRCLLNKGAEIIALPSAFTVPTGKAHWEVLTRSRAIENFCYVIGACQGGTHPNGKTTYGHSLMIDPWGTVIAEMTGSKEGIILSSIDREKIYSARQSIPSGSHQRIFKTKG